MSVVREGVMKNEWDYFNGDVEENKIDRSLKEYIDEIFDEYGISVRDQVLQWSTTAEPVQTPTPEEEKRRIRLEKLKRVYGRK
jgi:division protein CdvB (Snf7/Vps24/ESCRT-III family)